MKTISPIETIRNAYGPTGEAVAEAVIMLVAQSARITADIRDGAADNPLGSIMASHISEELTKATSKVVGDLIKAVLEPDEAGGFLAACHAESDRREQAANKVVACLKELMV